MLSILVLGAYRDTDLDRRQPLAEALTSLRRAPVFERIPLRGLSAGEVEALMEARAGHALDAPGLALAAAVHRETEGNPFFVGETLRHLTETGGISERDGHWTIRATSIAELGIPEGVREVIGRRLSRLSEPCNQLLAIAAVMGREFDAGILEQVSGQSADELDEALAEATSAVVVAEVAGGVGRYSFSHALIRETLFHELPTRRRVRLHRQLGEALEARYGARADLHAPALAYHFSEAAGSSPLDASKALRYSRLAAEQAESVTAWEEAVAYFERCLSLIAETGPAVGNDEAALLIGLGRCERNAGNPRAAWRNLMRAIDRARAHGDGLHEALPAVEALSMTAPPERRIAIARAALDSLGDNEPRVQVQLLIELPQIDVVWALGPDEMTRIRQQVHDLVAQQGLLNMEAELLAYDGMLASFDRDSVQAIDVNRAAYAACNRAGLYRQAGYALRHCSEGLLRLGRIEEALQAADAAMTYAREHHLREVEGMAANDQARAHMVRWDLPAFDAVFAEAGAHNPYTIAALARPLRAIAAGDTAAALALLPEPDALGRMARLTATIHGLRARVFWYAGDMAQARQEFSRLRQVLQSAPGTIAVEGAAVERGVIACLDDALPHLADPAFLAAAEQVVRELMTDERRSIVTWPLGECGWRVQALVLMACGHTEEAETRYREALAWCEQEHCPVEAGRCLQGLAEIAGSRGQIVDATQLLDKAAALFEQHGAQLYLRQVEASRLALPG